jgi:hypothetical protein
VKVDKGEALLAASAAISLFLIWQAVQEYNTIVANYPHDGWALMWYLDKWNAAILWLRHQIYLRMAPFVATLLGLAAWRTYRGWKKSGEPLWRYVIRSYVEYYSNLARRLDKWVSTNTSEGA